MSNNQKAVLSAITEIVAHELTINDYAGAPVFGLRAIDGAGHSVGIVFGKNNRFTVKDSDGSSANEVLGMANGDRVGYEYNKDTGAYAIYHKPAAGPQVTVHTSTLDAKFVGDIIFNFGNFGSNLDKVNTVTLDGVATAGAIALAYSAGAEIFDGTAV